jgi:hypothetical protein
MRTHSGKHSRSTAAAKHVRRVAPRPSSEQAAPMPSEVESHAAFDPDLRHRMISEAAYYLHTQRGYADGYDLDDWLEAEAKIDDLIMSPDPDDAREVSAPLASP